MMSLPPPSSVFAEANPICLISPIGPILLRALGSLPTPGVAGP